MTKVDILEEANALTVGKDQTLSAEEREAIENLNDEDLRELLDMKQQIKDRFNIELLFSPPTHHHGVE